MSYTKNKPEFVSLSDGTDVYNAATAAAQTDGTQKSIVRGGAKGATTAADVTSTANGADHQALDVIEQLAPGYEDGTNLLALVLRRPVAVSTYCPSFFANRGANATLNVKVGSGNVFAVTCQNLNGSLRYLQLHNTATVPTTTVTSVGAAGFEFPVPANGSIVIGEDFFTENGLNFPLGVAFAFSTTTNLYTAGTASDQATQIVYK